MTIHLKFKSCSDIVREVVLNDPAERFDTAYEDSSMSADGDAFSEDEDDEGDDEIFSEVAEVGHAI